MPLFFVMSGFFSAMLLHRRGRGALVKHRFLRVFLPLLLGMVTIVPATFGISFLAGSSGPRSPPARRRPGGGHLGVRGRETSAPSSGTWPRGDVNGLGGQIRSTPLQRAALADRVKAVELLIRRGANVNAAKATKDAVTPAAFWATRRSSGARSEWRERQRREQPGRNATRGRDHRREDGTNPSRR